MGIRIETSGRLGRARYEFKEGSGSAAAVAKAIHFLSAELFPKAISHDHQAHDAGVEPENGWCGYHSPDAPVEENEPEVMQPPVQRKRGRPKGSKNKPKAPAVFADPEPEPLDRSVIGAENADVQQALAELEEEDDYVPTRPTKSTGWEDS